MPTETVGVVVMAYGTPAEPADIERYYTHIRRGRPPTPELLGELRARYEAIGGTSPLLARTQAQAASLQVALGNHFEIELGMKHAPPFIEGAVRSLADRGIRRAVGIVLAPHYSRLSVGEYVQRARTAAAATDMDLAMVESWHLETGYVGLLAEYVSDAVASLGASPVEVVFTAHSLPARIVEEHDPYPEQVSETAAAVAERAGIGRWSVAWQSAGRTAERWIGPDILDVLRDRAAGGSGGVVVCPGGFVSDHLEVLYDIDIEARAIAADLQLPFARTRMPNDAPAFGAALAEVVRRRAGERP